MYFWFTSWPGIALSLLSSCSNCCTENVAILLYVIKLVLITATQGKIQTAIMAHLKKFKMPSSLAAVILPSFKEEPASVNLGKASKSFNHNKNRKNELSSASAFQCCRWRGGRICQLICRRGFYFILEIQNKWFGLMQPKLEDIC